MGNLYEYRVNLRVPQFWDHTECNFGASYELFRKMEEGKLTCLQRVSRAYVYEGDQNGRRQS